MEPLLNYDFEGSHLVKNIEHYFKRRFNLGNSVLVTSASMAFYTAILSLNIKEKSEVILPVNICQSMVNCVILLGFIPVFADIDDDLCMDIGDLFNKVSPSTSIIVFVHPFGFPLELNSTIAQCKKLGIYTIEDCAQAPGALIKGNYVGNQGDFSIFSFGQNKPISAGGGGILSSKNNELIQKARVIAREGAQNYPNFISVGLNLSVNEIHALYIYFILKSFDEKLILKDKRIERYKKYFTGKLNYVGDYIDATTGSKSIFHKMILKLPDTMTEEECVKFNKIVSANTIHNFNIIQTALTNPPFKVKFVNQYLEMNNRSELAYLPDSCFPGWRKNLNRYLYLSTHDLVNDKSIDIVSTFILSKLSSS